VRKLTRKNRPLADEIDRLKRELLHDCTQGEKLLKDRTPAYYAKKWSLTNLYKCDLRQGYRVTYTLGFEGAGLAVILLELLSHDEYNERFGYKIS
jgi:hypothetical protein